MTPHPEPLDASLLLTAFLRAAAGEAWDRELDAWLETDWPRMQNQTLIDCGNTICQADRELGMGASGQQVAEPFAEVV